MCASRDCNIPGVRRYNVIRSCFLTMFQVIKAGGCVLIRDYGLYDHAMLRFKPGHKLAENLYVRQDLTRAYYFALG